MDLRRDERIHEFERDGFENYSHRDRSQDLATTIYNLFAHIALEAFGGVRRPPGR